MERIRVGKHDDIDSSLLLARACVFFRSTEEIFALFISMAFAFDAFKDVVCGMTVSMSYAILSHCDVSYLQFVSYYYGEQRRSIHDVCYYIRLH